MRRREAAEALTIMQAVGLGNAVKEDIDLPSKGARECGNGRADLASFEGECDGSNDDNSFDPSAPLRGVEEASLDLARLPMQDRVAKVKLRKDGNLSNRRWI